jgi:hypothetical protein
MGSLVDHRLTNHKFIEFQRQILGIKGKRGKVPDPLKGTYTVKENPTQKVVLRLDSNGRYEGKLKPTMSEIVAGNFTIIIDKKDEAIKDHIINRFLREQGLTRENVIINEIPGATDSPQLQASLEIDIEQFKMAILKIAYEFTVDQVPSYLDDLHAVKLSTILFDVDYQRLKTEVTFFGNGFNSEILQPFEHLLDIDNNSHYLILLDSPELGLLCFVNLFNTFSIGIEMTKQSGFIKDSLLVLKNDLTGRKKVIYNMEEIVKATYSDPIYRFQYHLPARQELIDEFTQNELRPNFEFYTINDKTPFFRKDGTVAFEDINLKLFQGQLQRIVIGDTINMMTDEIVLDEELFVKLLPINKLYKVISVEISRTRINKI